MVLYKMTDTGHIYKIICKVDPTFCYIGSTFDRLSKRFELHRKDFNRWLEGKNKKGISCFPYYQKYGIDNFKIVLIKSYEVCRSNIKDRKHLEAYETLWINRHRGKCCNEITPLNLLKKEKRKAYREKNRERIEELNKQYREKNKQHIAEKVKEYRQKNRERIEEIEKAYREKNREQIAEKRKEKVQCECGSVVSKRNLSQHKKSQKHQRFMAQK